MKNKIIASGLAGLALFGGTIAFAVSGSSPASATTTAQSALTQDRHPQRHPGLAPPAPQGDPQAGRGDRGQDHRHPRR